jgi:hypothetical protein
VKVCTVADVMFAILLVCYCGSTLACPCALVPLSQQYTRKFGDGCFHCSWFDVPAKFAGFLQMCCYAMNALFYYGPPSVR